MNKIWIALGLLLLIQGALGVYRFTTKSQDISVKSGSGFSIFAAAANDEAGVLKNNNWYKCRWSYGNQHCEFTYVCSGIFCAAGNGKWSIESKCSQEMMESAKFDQQDIQEMNQKCGLRVIKSLPSMNGTWTVQIEECARLGCNSGGIGSWIQTHVDVKVNK